MMPQHKDEICLSAMAVKTEKKSLNGTWLNPKCFYSGQSAAKPRIEEGSTTKRLTSVW